MLTFNESNSRLWSKLGQRAAFGAVAAPEIIATSHEALFLAADVAASSGLDRLASFSPDRLINMGIAEQNMIGAAAGLASQGYIPYVISFAPFITARCADQLRMCAGYMDFPIKAVGLGSGLAMGINGASHLGLEDIAIMREIPGIAILAPADPAEAIQGALACLDWPGPAYLRLTGAPGDPAFPVDETYAIGKSVTLRKGGDIAIFAHGSIVANCMAAADLLAADGVDAQVVNMRSIKPLDEEVVARTRPFKMLVTVEEHFLTGGLGSVVAEYLSGLSGYPPLLRIGLEKFPRAAPYKLMLVECGLDGEAIAARINERLKTLC